MVKNKSEIASFNSCDFILMDHKWNDVLQMQGRVKAKYFDFEQL